MSPGEFKSNRSVTACPFPCSKTESEVRSPGRWICASYDEDPKSEAIHTVHFGWEGHFILAPSEIHYLPAASLIAPNFYWGWRLESTEETMPNSLAETCLLFPTTMARLHRERQLQSKTWERQAGLCHSCLFPTFYVFAAARSLARQKYFLHLWVYQSVPPTVVR